MLIVSGVCYLIMGSRCNFRDIWRLNTREGVKEMFCDQKVSPGRGGFFGDELFTFYRVDSFFESIDGFLEFNILMLGKFDIEATNDALAANDRWKTK